MIVNDKRSMLAAAIISLGLLVVWGCEGQKPLGPAKPISVSVAIPVNDSLKASLLGSTTNEVVYVVGKNGTTLLKGSTGTFASSSVTGSVNFTFQVPSGADEILSVQLNDGTTHLPLAVGAMPLGLSEGGTEANVSIELGSVNRNCYYLRNSVGINDYGVGFDAQFINTNSMIPASSYASNLDVVLGYDTGYGGNYIVDAGASPLGVPDYSNSIAYLGNGDLIDFDYVPPTTNFYYTSWTAKYNAYTAPSHGGGGEASPKVLFTRPRPMMWRRVTFIASPWTPSRVVTLGSRS